MSLLNSGLPVVPCRQCAPATVCPPKSECTCPRWRMAHTALHLISIISRRASVLLLLNMTIVVMSSTRNHVNTWHTSAGKLKGELWSSKCSSGPYKWPLIFKERSKQPLQKWQYYCKLLFSSTCWEPPSSLTGMVGAENPFQHRQWY